MQRAQDIIGLPVIDVSEGKRIAAVKDILLDEAWALYGILLDAKHWFSSPRTIHWEHIISIGQDAVTIEDDAIIKPFDHDTPLYTLMTGHEKVMGRPVITVNGIQVGVLEDVYFHQKLGRKVRGFELSDGFISDLKEGRKWLPLAEKVTVGDDTIIVPVHSDLQLEKPNIN